MTPKFPELVASLSQEFEVANCADSSQEPQRVSPYARHDNDIGVIGSVVDDLYLQPIPGQPVTTKTTCTKSKRRGGGAHNVAHAMANYGGQPKPVFLIGKDGAGTEAMSALRAEFPRVLFVRCYVEMRSSVILPDGKCFTTRPSLNLNRVSEPIRAALSTVAWTVVAPFGCDDFSFVEDVLRIAPRSVLMLSKDQLSDRESVLRLVKAATRVVLNHEEGATITGHKDARLAIDALVAAGWRGVVITTPYGAEAHLDGQPEFRPAVVVERVKGTVGAGDTFTGDERQHDVRIKHAFQLHRYQVTNAQYELFDPAHFVKRDRYSNEDEQPVTSVSWYDAWCFAKWVYSDGKCCALPTEAQWEYSCRAGTTTPFHFGSISDGTQSNIHGIYPYGTQANGPCLGKTSSVGSYPPNGFGLHDMHGNVAEWRQDWYGEYPAGRAEDPVGPQSGQARVVRGGSWLLYARLSRAADRSHGFTPDWHHPVNGIRLSRTP